MSKQVSGWLLAAGIVVIGCAAQAAERIKANNVTNLNVASSWVGSSVPGALDYGKWNNTVTSENAVLLGGNLSVQGLMIANPGGAVAIGGNNTLTVGFVGFNMGAATVDLTVTNQNVTLLDYAGQLWTVAAGRTLTFGPAQVTRGVGASLGVVGGGTVASSVLVNDAAGLIGPWAWTGTGAAAKYATVSGGAVTGYTGTAAAPATVADTTGATNYEVSALGTLGADASFNTLRYTGASGTLAGNFSANGLLNAGAGGLTFSGNATIGAGKELVLITPDGTRTLTLSGVVGDNAGGASGITVTGGGKVSLTGNNTYSGLTVVSAGTLYVTKTNALGSAVGNTVVYVNGSSVTGGMLQVSGNITITEPLTFVGTGDGSPWNSAVSIPGSGGTNTFAGPITLALPAGVRFSASGPGTGININGPITRTSSGNTLILGAGGIGGVVNVNYPINNNGGSLTTHNGPGLVRFNAAGSNIGALNVQTAHLVQLGVSDAFVSSASLQVGGASNTSGDQARGTFDLNGFNQTFNSFNGDGVPAEPTSLRVVTNSAATLSVLTIGSGSSGGTFNGIIDGNIALVKNGTGVQTNRGPNRYTGGTTVNGGTLVLSNAVSHGSLTVNGGTFLFSPSLTVNGTLSGNGGTVDTVAAGNVLTVNQSTNSTFAGVLSNAGSLVKTGPGTLTLTGGNTYSGGTTVSQGALCFGKTASKPSSGAVTVAAGAGLGLGLGGTGGFSSSDVDTLWADALSGVTLDASSLIGIDTAAGDVTYASSQSTRGLIKTGANTLTLTGVNTYAGGTYVQAGILSIPTTGALPGWNTGGSYLIARDAGLVLGNAVSDSEVATILGTGNFASGGFFGFDTSVSNRTYAGIISNTLNGTLGLIKSGTNTLTLTASNTYDGITYLNGGKVVIKHSNALGSTNGYTVVNRAGGTSPLFTDATGMLLLDGSAGALTIDENFIINGDQQYGYTGSLRNSAGNNVINGSITVGPIGSARIGVDAGNLVLNGPILRMNASANPMLVLNPSAGLLIVSNRIDIGTGLVNFHSGSPTVLCSTNTTWGSAQIQYGGSVRLGIDDGMAFGKRVTIGNPEPGNGRLDLYGYSQTIGGLFEYGNAASKPNNIITNGRPLSASTLTVSQSSGTVDFFSGRLMGALNLVKTGAANSILTLAGANTFNGATTVSGGSLVLSNQVALQNSTLTVTGGLVGFGGGITAFTLGGLAGAQNIGLTNALGSVIELSVGNNNSNTVYSGNLSAGGSLIKVGTGTLTLAGVNSYMGTTTLSNGTLALGCDNALSSDARLIFSGGTLNPGVYSNTLGKLSVTGAGTLALGDGSCQLAFADSTDQAWTGTLNVTGNWVPSALRFGTDATALTKAQLSSFRADGQRVWVQIDEHGYLWKMTGTLLRLQ